MIIRNSDSIWLNQVINFAMFGSQNTCVLGILGHLDPQKMLEACHKMAAIHLQPWLIVFFVSIALILWMATSIHHDPPILKSLSHGQKQTAICWCLAGCSHSIQLVLSSAIKVIRWFQVFLLLFLLTKVWFVTRGLDFSLSGSMLRRQLCPQRAQMPLEKHTRLL